MRRCWKIIMILIMVLLFTGSSTAVFAEGGGITVKTTDTTIYAGSDYEVEIDVSGYGGSSFYVASLHFTSSTDRTGQSGWYQNSKGIWMYYLDEEKYTDLLTCDYTVKDGIVTAVIHVEKLMATEEYRNMDPKPDGIIFFVDNDSSSVTYSGALLDETASIADVTAKLNALKNASDITLNDEAAVKNARTAFDKLSGSLQEKVDSGAVKKLTDAEAAIEKLKKGDTGTNTSTDTNTKTDTGTDPADKQKADTAAEAIGALPDPGKITVDDEAAVEKAGDLYDALSGDQKKLVPADTVKKLEAARARITAIKTAEAKDKNAEKKVEKVITSYKKESDPAGSSFLPLQPKAAAAKSSIKLTWKKVAKAKKYVVYGINCGKKNKLKKLASVRKTSYTVKKINNKKLAGDTYYKFIITAVGNTDGYNKVLAKSKLLHAVIRNSNKTNVKKIKASQTKKTIKVKESFTIKTATTLEAPKLKYAKHAGIRFESDKPAIASVDKKGKVKGKKAGKAAIYAYAQNGVFVKIKVTVKK